MLHFISGGPNLAPVANFIFFPKSNFFVYPAMWLIATDLMIGLKLWFR